MITSLHRIQRHEIQFQVTKRLQNLNLTKFSDPRPPKCVYFHLLLLTYDHFIKRKAENREIPFLITKRDQKFNLRRFSDPSPPNCAYFHLLLLTHDHFIKPKTEKRKIPFLVTKRDKKSYPTCFLIYDPQILGSFICNFDS